MGWGLEEVRSRGTGITAVGGGCFLRGLWERRCPHRPKGSAGGSCRPTPRIQAENSSAKVWGWRRRCPRGSARRPLLDAAEGARGSVGEAEQNGGWAARGPGATAGKAQVSRAAAGAEGYAPLESRGPWKAGWMTAEPPGACTREAASRNALQLVLTGLAEGWDAWNEGRPEGGREDAGVWGWDNSPSASGREARGSCVHTEVLEASLLWGHGTSSPGLFPSTRGDLSSPGAAGMDSGTGSERSWPGQVRRDPGPWAPLTSPSPGPQPLPCLSQWRGNGPPGHRVGVCTGCWPPKLASWACGCLQGRPCSGPGLQSEFPLSKALRAQTPALWVGRH